MIISWAEFSQISSLTTTTTTTTSAAIANYYLSPTGSDGNNGTSISTPLFSFNALVALNPPAGSLVYLRGGTYAYSVVQNITLAGTSSNYILVENYPGEYPIFTRSGPNLIQNLLYIDESSYVHFKGFAVSDFFQIPTTNWNQFVIWVDGSSDLIFEMIHVHNCMSGLEIHGASTNIQVINCDSWENNDPYTYDGDSAGVDSWSEACGFGSVTDLNTANAYTGCRTWGNTNDGFDILKSNGAYVFLNCWAYRVGYLPDTITGNIGDGSSGGSRWGFKLGIAPAAANNTYLRSVINCWSAFNYGGGIGLNDDGTTIPSCYIYNNTTYNNQGAQYTGGYDFSEGNAQTLINNAAYDEMLACYVGSNMIENNNTWDSGFSASSSDFVSLSPARVTSLRQANGSLPVVTFLQRSSSSSLNTQGVNLGLSNLPLGSNTPIGYTPATGYNSSTYSYSYYGTQMTILSTPALNTPTANSSSVTLTWSTVTNVTNWGIEYTTNLMNWRILNPYIPGTTLTYTHNNLAPSTLYFYRLTAIGDGINYSNSSTSPIASIITSVPSLTALSSSTLNAPTAGSTSISLTWSRSTNNVGYQIWRSPDGVHDWLQVGSTSTNTESFTDSIVTLTTYGYNLALFNYYVIAIGDNTSHSNSLPSNIASPGGTYNLSLSTNTLNLTAPLGTSSITVTASAGLTWTTYSSASWLTITSTSSGSGSGTINLSYPMNSLTSSINCYITVVGTQVPLQIITVTQAGTSGGATQLTAPTLSLSVVSSSQINATWTQVTNNSGYQLQQSPTGTGSWTTIATTTTNTDSYNVTGLTQNTTYYYQVLAVGNGTTHSNSNYSTVQSDITQTTTVYSYPFTSLGTSNIIGDTLSASSSVTGAVSLLNSTTAFTFTNNVYTSNAPNATCLLYVSGAVSAVVVNISYNVFTFQNTTNSVNSYGDTYSTYVILVGSDSPNSSSKGYYNGATFIGNSLTGVGTLANTHASLIECLMLGDSQNGIWKYNFLTNCPYGIPTKAYGTSNSSGVIGYNCFLNCVRSLTVKGVSGTNLFNNTFVANDSSSSDAYTFIAITVSDDGTQKATGTVIKNNVFYSNGYWSSTIIEVDQASIAGLACDYNIYYDTQGILFRIIGNANGVNGGETTGVIEEFTTLADWQAYGATFGLTWDAHSQVINPNLNLTTLVPTSKLSYGTNLGSTYQLGISPSNTWNATTTATATQPSTWECGAFVI